MDRRRFLLTSLTGALVEPRAAEAQRARRVYRLGYLGVNRSSDVQPHLKALRLGLRELGWVEGENVQIDYRWAAGQSERLAQLADDLVRQQVDVLIVPTSQAVRAAQSVTRTIPIVMVAGNDPVSEGLIATLARPGGNITGLIFDPGSDLCGKQVELLVQAVPKLSRLAILTNRDNPSHGKMTQSVRTGARPFGIQLEFFEAHTYDGAKKALGQVATAKAGAILVVSDGIWFAQSEQIVEFAFKQRLPTIFPWKQVAAVGGLMTYGANLVSNWHRAASFVDRILKGARPGDLPVELPTTFELVINLKTAKALGLAIPPSLLARADQVIE